MSNDERDPLLDGSQLVNELPKINLNMLTLKRFAYSLPTITMLALGGYLYDGKAMPKIIQSCEKNFDWSRAAVENAALMVKVVALLSLWTLKCGMMHWPEPLYRIVQWSKLPEEWSGNSMKVELMMAWGINIIFCLCNTLLQLNDVTAETALPVTIVSCTFLFWSLEVGGIPKAAVNCFDRCSPRATPEVARGAAA